MPSLSKRDFLKTCYETFVAALLSPLMPFGIGCTQRNGAQVSSNGVDHPSSEPSRWAGWRNRRPRW